MKSESVLLKNIEILGDKYVQAHVRTLDKGRLERDWWEAIKFIFSRSFMRGRRDELSARYFNFTIGVLKDLIGIDEASSEDAYSKLVAQRGLFEVAKEMKKKSLKAYPEFAQIVESNPIVRALSERKTDNKDTLALGNIGDIVMVLEVLAFITERVERKNIYLYLLEKIEKGHGVRSAFCELMGMKYIGDKIASFIIRDILLLNPDISLKEDEYECAFPVDTWVNQIAEKIGCKRKTLEETKGCLIEEANINGLNVFKFAAGLWYLGFNSLEVLLDGFLEYHEIAR